MESLIGKLEVILTCVPCLATTTFCIVGELIKIIKSYQLKGCVEKDPK